MRRLALVVIAPIAVATLAVMIWMWPPGLGAPEEAGAAEQLNGEVTGVDREQCRETIEDDVNGCGNAQVRVADGAEAGQEVEAPLPNGPGAPRIDEGDEVVLILSDSPEGEMYSIVDHQRAIELWVLAAAFVLALVAFGR